MYIKFKIPDSDVTFWVHAADLADITGTVSEVVASIVSQPITVYADDPTDIDS
jgi:hypothetical protein